MNSSLTETITHRINSRIPIRFLKQHISESFYIAGNSLNRGNPNDIDLFPSDGNPFSVSNEIWTEDGQTKSIKILSKTKNAITTNIHVDGNSYIVQFCNYIHPSLEDLVNSFDFSHVQVGAHVNGLHDTDYKIYFTDDYVKSKLIESTEYTKSEYPLSSLLRTFKYHKRNDFSGKSYFMSVFKILNDIIDRGFRDYHDFKDQLDAIDLGLLPEDFKELDMKILVELFGKLRKDQPNTGCNGNCNCNCNHSIEDIT